MNGGDVFEQIAQAREIGDYVARDDLRGELGTRHTSELG